MLYKLFLWEIILCSFLACNRYDVKSEEIYDDIPKVIFDTDIDSDVDDVGALAILLNMHDAGLIDLVGIIVTSDDPFSPVCANAICTYYGFPDIPVGFLKNQPSLVNRSRYTKTIADEFPSKLTSWEDAYDAVKLYRNLLSESSDESTYIVTVGHLSSLEELLNSNPDEISDFSGEELVNKKVRGWFCMGGQFPEGKEANFYRPDPQSTVVCVEKWEKEVIFCGAEIGNKVYTGGAWLKQNLDPSHPVYRSYELYNDFKGRQSWDQLAVIQLLRNKLSYFHYVKGTCSVSADGSNTWENNSNGKHNYLTFTPGTKIDNVESSLDSMMTGLWFKE